MRLLLPHVLIVGVVTAALATAHAPPADAHAIEPAPSAMSALPTQESLRPTVLLSAERGQLADLVAAAKWESGQPIEDPEREQQVLDAVARQSEAMGIDPRVSTRIFRDQIEASKVIQHALHRYWEKHPDQAPTDPPDLGDVRPAIDRINTLLLEQIRDTASVRVRPSCGIRLIASFHSVAHDERLDPLHQTGLARALPSVCARPDIDRVPDLMR